MKAKYKKWLKWGAIALGAVAIFGASAAIATSIASRDDETYVLKSSDYALYTLDDTTGVADTEDQSNISTKKFYLLDGLTCEIAEDAEITYQLNFYDEDKQFISVADYDEDFDGSEIDSLESQGVVYVRIEILPTADSDGLVGTFEKSGYVEQLTVTVQNEDN